MTDRLRIATFNLENFDEDNPDPAKMKNAAPLVVRIALMRPQLLRLNADILCLQEVHSQKAAAQRELRALDQLLVDTPYAGFQRVSTVDSHGHFLPLRNLVILSRFPILDHQQYMNKFVPAPLYQVVTADPPATAPTAVGWERPLLHAKIDLPNVGTLQIINVHLKSKNPTEVKGQQKDQFTWKTAGGWAEGSFLSAMKRVGQALEARQLIDSIFTEDPDALIAICGDFNSTYDEVPVEAIRGDVEDHGNRELVGRVMVPCERTVPESSRFSLYHHGKGEMLDHILVSRRLLTFYTRTEIHNELLHDESTAFATDDKFPESDHAPVVTEFQVPG